MYATTKSFLDDLGLASLEQLPALQAGTEPPAFEALQGQLLDMSGAPEDVPEDVPEEVPETAPAAEAAAPMQSLFGDDGTPALPNSDPTDPTDPPPQPQPQPQIA